MVKCQKVGCERKVQTYITISYDALVGVCMLHAHGNKITTKREVEENG